MPSLPKWYHPWGLFAGIALLCDVALAGLLLVIGWLLYMAVIKAASCAS